MNIQNLCLRFVYISDFNINCVCLDNPFIKCLLIKLS